MKPLLLLLLMCVAVSCIGHETVYEVKKGNMQCKCAVKIGSQIFIRKDLLKGKISIDYTTYKDFVVITIMPIEESTSTEDK